VLSLPVPIIILIFMRKSCKVILGWFAGSWVLGLICRRAVLGNRLQRTAYFAGRDGGLVGISEVYESSIGGSEVEWMLRMVQADLKWFG
jgi:hypothetical protein